MKFRTPNVPRSISTLFSVTAALALCACGGGGDPTSELGAREAPLANGNGMPKPPAFVPLATPLPADATEYDKHMQIARISWDQNDDITAPHWCAVGVGSNPNLGDRTLLRGAEKGRIPTAKQPS